MRDSGLSLQYRTIPPLAKSCHNAHDPDWRFRFLGRMTCNPEFRIHKCP